MTDISLKECLRDFLKSRQASNRGARTIEWYEQQVGCWVDFIQSKNLSEGAEIFDPDLFEDFLLSERERAALSDSGVHARFRAARTFFNWLHKRERRRLRTTVLDWDPPTSLIEPPREPITKPRVANEASVDRLLASIRKLRWVDLRDRCVLESLRSCGLRVSEACNLLVTDVDVTAGFVFVRAGKGEKDRYVPFGDRFTGAFLEYQFNRPPTTCVHLFVSANGHNRVIDRQMNDNGVRQMIRRRCAEAGIEYFNPHSVRHLYAIDALNRGMKADALSMAMGHSSVSFTLRRYAKWQKSGLRDEYDSSIRR